MDDYELLDCGNGRKLERFGKYITDRPAAQALWPTHLSTKEWKKAYARFERIDEKHGNWKGKALPEEWVIKVAGIKLTLSLTPFGHLGIFPEQISFWKWLNKTCKASKKPLKVLNLFAYSGGATLACAQAGAKVTHLDASKPMVRWAKNNAELNKLPNDRVSWITEDVLKYMKREIKRGNHYDALIMDPPSFGRGNRGEIFKIERDLNELLKCTSQLLSDSPSFVLLSCHTPGVSATVLLNMLQKQIAIKSGEYKCGEMLCETEFPILPLPNGVYARYKSD